MGKIITIIPGILMMLSGSCLADNNCAMKSQLKIHKPNRPKYQDGSVWWKIEFIGHRGWSTQMSAAGKYYLEK